MKRVAVIGAGASGLMAAYAAAKNGAFVTVFEKNEKAGKKIYITGKGRCNVTNACSKDEFFENVVTNKKFMYSAFSAFSNIDLMEFLEENGTKLKIERGQRVFPVSDHASDITKALIASTHGLKVEYKFNNSISTLPNDYDSVILATGGASYPGAGGGMSGYRLAEKTGLRVTELYPSLVPFLLKEDYTKELQGLSLKNITLSVYKDEKRVFREFGELIFTHFGISGPLVLTASAYLGPVISEQKSLKAEIDLKPAIPDDELEKRLLDMIEQNGKKLFKSFFGGILPKSMHAVFIKLSGINPESKICDIKKEERKRIFSLLRRFPITITGMRGYEEAVVTKGGVNVKDINPRTMECKNHPGIYVCGELLDVDALTGGFNLQCAFSTGYLAGLSAATE